MSRKCNPLPAWAIAVALSIFLAVTLSQRAGASPSDRFPPSSTPVYKTVEDRELHLWIWKPTNGRPSGKGVPAIVLFHGGGWVAGKPAQFAELAALLTNYGMLAVSAEYRLSQRGNVEAGPAIDDARSAIRWIRDHAVQFDIDPTRIAAGGGSAGGHLALAANVIAPPAGQESDGAAQTDALVLFNPMFAVPRGSEQYSVIDALQKPLPPTLIMHGTMDRTSPFENAEAFVRRARMVGSKTVDLIPFDNRQHGFFNDRGFSNPDFLATAQDVVEFFHRLGWIACGRDEAADCNVTRP